MIQFLGVALGLETVRAVSLGRKLRLTAQYSTPLTGRRSAESSGADTGRRVECIRPAEWTRSAAFALQELWLQLGVADRKLWGMALVGPPGWIAIDHEFQPLGDLRILPPEHILDDIAEQIAAEPKLRPRIAAILTPKDWFRFVISQSLAIDAPTVSRLGALDARGTEWSAEALAARDIERSWFPPVFATDATTSRLSEEGIRRVGIPSSIWLTAGCDLDSAALAASGDTRKATLWLPPTGPTLYTPLRHHDGDTPSGWHRHPAPWSGHWLLARDVRTDDHDTAGGELESAGLGIERVERRAGDAALGAACLAAVASDLVQGWDALYAKWEALSD